MKNVILSILPLALLSPADRLALAEGIEVNGSFETGDGLGWKAGWRAFRLEEASDLGQREALFDRL